MSLKRTKTQLETNNSVKTFKFVQNSNNAFPKLIFKNFRFSNTITNPSKKSKKNNFFLRESSE